MKKVLITILLIIEIFMINLTYQSFLHKEINKEENKVDKKQFAMFIKENDEYVEYKGDNLFPKDYYVNKGLSKCVDENGNPVDNAISSIGTNVTVTSNKTVYCTLYFDKNEILEYLRSKDTNGVLSADIVGDMYRYQGVAEEYASDDLKVVDNNYLCLGSDCTLEGNDLYRIIGVTEIGELKVIRNSALPQTYQWHNDQTTNTEWPDSDLFHRLNDYEEGTYKDSSFYSLLDNKLKKVIVKHNWLYGDSNSGGDYDGNIMFQIESGKKETIHGVIDTDGSLKHEPYIWKNSINAYIGLQYVHDYLLTYPGGKPVSFDNAHLAWIYLKTEDTDLYAKAEWLMTRQGYYDNQGTHYYSSYDICNYKSNLGYIRNGSNVAISQSIRPVFYLTNDIDLIGEGTLTEPFEIDYEKTGVDIINSKPTNLSTEEVGGMHRYQGTNEDVNNNYICFGTNDRDECLKNPKVYLYRILGISSSGEMKLTKQRYLENPPYSWSTDYTINIKWPDSNIFKGINGNGFLDNELFLPTNDKINWKEKILTKDWYYGDTLDRYETGENLYEIETGNKTTSWVEKLDGVTSPSEEITCNVVTSGKNIDKTACYHTVNDKWQDKISAKIGILYLHDNKFAMGKQVTCIPYSTCENSWLLRSELDNNENIYYIFITRNGYYYVWDSYMNISSSYTIPGSTTGVPTNTIGARPTFYISKDIIFQGKGTLNYPYMIVK